VQASRETTTTASRIKWTLLKVNFAIFRYFILLSAGMLLYTILIDKNNSNMCFR
jgi:hypothetical protein